MTATNETPNNVREAKERERRRKKYKFALVQWAEDWGNDGPKITVEYKEILRQWWTQSHTILCDDQPEKVLRGMLKLMKENEDEI